VTAFTREIKILPGYDHRDDMTDRGAHGCDMILILRGPDGAIAARISTGWMTHPLAGRYVHRGGRQARRDKPGVDAGVAHLYPSGSYVGAHSLKPREAYLSSDPECSWLDGAPCYGDGSFTMADEVLEALAAGGSDAAFERMASLYQSWILDRPVVTPELPAADDVIDVEYAEVLELEGGAR
jgi:hypothetical protein